MPSVKKAKRKALTKALERRIILEAGGVCPWCKTKIKRGEVEIHHIDEDPSNNSPENLILMCRNCHGRATEGLIPKWEAILQKQILCNPGTMERLGLTRLPPSAPPPPIVGGDNHGVAGQNVNIGTLKMTKDRSKDKRRTPIAGLVEANADMQTYAIYLVKRYILWRKNGKKIDPRPFDPGSAHSILGEGFGCGNSVLKVTEGRFFEWVAQAQHKIDRTVFGLMNTRKGNPNYHSWEDHLKERHGSK